MDQFLTKHHSKFTWLMDWIYVLVVINLLAIAGTIVGLGIFGFFPSWMTAHHVIKQKLNREDISLTRVFAQTYKNYFVKANVLGYILVITGVVIASSWIFYVRDLTSAFHWVGLIVLGFLAIIWLLMVGITPISFVYFPKFKMFEHIKFSLIMTMGMPMLALVIFFNSLFFYGVVMIRFISIFPFLAFTLPVLVNVLFARKKLLKLFTVSSDEHTMIRTLNSYANFEGLWSLWDQNILDVKIDHDTFMTFINDGSKINRRASLVLTNTKEEPLGMLLTRVYENTLWIELLYIDTKYQKRGYAKKMIQWLEKIATDAEIENIMIGNENSLFSVIPRPLNMSLSFFHKQGYTRISAEEGYKLIKHLGGQS